MMEYIKTQHANILKGNPNDIGCVIFDKGLSNKSIKDENCVNGSFFTWTSNKEYFSTSPLVVDGKVYQGMANHGKPQSCIIIYKDGKVEMKKINNASEINIANVKLLIGGVGICNNNDSSFKYDPQSEGFSGMFSDVLRNTYKTLVGYKKSENVIMLITCKLPHSSSSYDLLDLAKANGLDMCISVDGGGSSFMKCNGKYVTSGQDGRRIANIITMKNSTSPTPTTKKKLVILSDGHGENTAGKCSHRFNDGYVLKENHFNEAVVDYIKSYLSNYNCDVVHVSEGKEDTPLKIRTDNANTSYKDMCIKYGKENVDCVYVSIHANHDGGKEWSQAHGIGTFAYPNTDKTLHTVLLNKLVSSTGLRNRGVKEENFHELRETSMTACLCECGFMSNLNEATLLRSDDYRRKCATAITDGIAEYMKLEKKIEDKPIEPTKPPIDDTNIIYRVCVGSYANRDNAEKLKVELEGKGYKPFIVIYEK